MIFVASSWWRVKNWGGAVAGVKKLGESKKLGSGIIFGLYIDIARYHIILSKKVGYIYIFWYLAIRNYPPVVKLGS